ncbi:MAG: RimK family alpha-L-glutamate ligase [Candidatus Hodarchaeota archaeon]
MRIGVFHYREKLAWPGLQLIKAIRNRNLTPVTLRIQQVAALVNSKSSLMISGNDLASLDAAIVRTIGRGTLDRITFRISALEHLEKIGVKVINSAYTYRRAKDKYASLFYLQKAGIPIPKTVITERLGEAIHAVEEIGEVVIKPLIGARGLGSIKTDNPDLAFRALKTIHRLGLVLYVQEYVPKPDRDIRAFVVGNEVIGAMYRTAPSNGWKTNISVGAKPTKCDLNEELKELAIKSTEALGLEYTGVDIVEGANGPVVLELNAAPSWRGLLEATGVNAADHIVDYLAGSMNR